MISRLLKKEYIIKKNVHPYAILEISQAGIEAIESIKNGRTEVINTLFQGYSEEERKSILERLNRLIKNLEGDNEDDKDN